ncbi:hypothetical protein Tco_0851356 [Tanacetum coccineum]
MVCTMAKPPKMLLYDASNTLRFSVFGMMNKVTYNERVKHKWGRMPFSSFPWPSYVTGYSQIQEKARSDNKRLRWSTAVEVKRTPCETKAPIKSM